MRQDEKPRRKHRWTVRLLVGGALFGFVPGALAEGMTRPQAKTVQKAPAPAREPAADDVRMALIDRVLGVDGLIADQMSLSLQDGTVTLRGHVKTLWARETAVREALKVRGVKAVVDRLVLLPPELPDHELKSRVTSSLSDVDVTSGMPLQVEARNGLIILRGDLDDFSGREAVRRVVTKVEGVRAVQDDLTITHEAQRERPDDEIRKDIMRRLQADDFLADLPVSVEVQGKRVTLSGRVDSEREKFLARNHAWVAGVLDIDDEEVKVDITARDKMLRTRAERQQPDVELSKTLDRVYHQDPRVGSVMPTVDVKNGMVTLVGDVGSELARRAVEEDARNVVGVFAVRSTVAVRPASVPSDADLLVAADVAMQHHPSLCTRAVDVDVQQGIVILTGSVRSEPERRAAGRLFKTLRGVRRVENRLKVQEQQVTTASLPPVLPPE